VIVVLDTSALFSMESIPGDYEAYTVPGVVDELKKYNDTRWMFWEHQLTVMNPSPLARKAISQASQATGDSKRLSPVDLDLLALAKDLNATILTDDYSIQNTAKFLGMQYRSVGMKAIKQLVKWNYKCLGCGKVFDKEMPDCPVCGSKLRTTRASH
jgi:endoribonuclease Nob1